MSTVRVSTFSALFMPHTSRSSARRLTMRPGSSASSSRICDLARRQLDLAPSAGARARARDRPRTGRRGSARRCQRAGALEQRFARARASSRTQNGLRHVVVGAEPRSPERRPPLSPWRSASAPAARRRARAARAHTREPVELGQHHVEQHQVEALARALSSALRPSSTALDLDSRETRARRTARAGCWASSSTTRMHGSWEAAPGRGARLPVSFTTVRVCRADARGL